MRRQKKEKVEVLLDFLNEYRSLGMLAAMRGVYEFAEEYSKSKGLLLSMEEYYTQRRLREEEYERELSPDEQLGYLETTLHYRRRLVSHFYQSLHIALRGGTVSKKEVFAIWPASWLDSFIHGILLPMGQDPDKHLEDLCEMAQEWK